MLPTPKFKAQWSLTDRHWPTISSTSLAWKVAPRRLLTSHPTPYLVPQLSGGWIPCSHVGFKCKIPCLSSFLLLSEKDPITADILADSTAIYFDGHLPEYKRPERLSRTRQASRVSQNYFLSTSAGIPFENSPKPRARDSEDHPVSILPNKRRNYALPVPSFLVPAVLDSLRSSSRYGPLTHLVPGEADPFCAQAVKRNGGTVLTSDSDLLLYDLGADGNVVFLNDIDVVEIATAQGYPEAAAPTRVISALVYNQNTILKNISPKTSLSDLLTFAYGLVMDADFSLAQWTAHAKVQHFHFDHDDDNYQNFVARYQEIPDSTMLAFGCMGFLDPRIAEFVLSMRDDTMFVYPALDCQPQRTPVFYLPQLLDRWDLGSAWITGYSIRQLAYGICCPISVDDQLVVVEYRRTLSESPQGQEVYLLSGGRAAQSLKDTLSFMLKILAVPLSCPSNLKWISLCLCLELSDATLEDRPSVALKAWKKAARACWLLDPGDWDAIHLAAHIQGTLYSLRILQQVLKCWQAGMVRCPEGLDEADVDEMLSHLSSLPPIAEYPTASNMADLFHELASSGLSAIIEMITGVSEPRPSVKINKKKKKQKQRKEERSGQQQRPRLTSVNPFDLLNEG